MIAAVIYAAKSTPDEKGSTEDQLAQVRKRLDEVGDREVVGLFSEENVSAYHGSRGPQLEAAMAAAVAAADERGEAELWVFHSSRLARGSGRKNEGRSLTEVHTYLRRHAVQLRSVEDDTFLTHPMLVSLASEISHKYSQDLSSHTRQAGDVQLLGQCRLPNHRLPHGLAVQLRHAVHKHQRQRPQQQDLCVEHLVPAERRRELPHRHLVQHNPSQLQRPVQGRRLRPVALHHRRARQLVRRGA